MADLGSFLDTKVPTKKKNSSATVGGSTPEGEVYIRADGKKVRRVKKEVTKSNSQKSLDPGASVDAGGPGEPTRGVKKTTPSSVGGLGSFLGSGSSAAGGRSGSATVAGERPAEDGEIYIRPDGKKVRRVRKVPSSGLGVDSMSTSASDLSAAGEEPKSKKDLSSFLNKQSDNGVKKGAAKSVSGEVYINQDGKKVRRVKKSSATSLGGELRKSSASVGGDFRRSKSDESVGDDVRRSKSGESVGGDARRSKSGESVGGEPQAHLRKPKLSSAASADGAGGLSQTPSAGRLAASKSGGLGGFLESGTTPGPKKKAGSASVAGSAPATQGEIYIRPDGTKVRRVKKQSSSSVSGGPDKLGGVTPEKGSGLANFLGNGDDPPRIPKGASASVSGPMRRSASPMRSSAISTKGSGGSVVGEGEVYINKDGKKVRRVIRTASAAAAPGPSRSSGGLGSFLSNLEGSGKLTGASTVTGATSSPSVAKQRSASSASGDSEVYINKDGKKVRRVRRTAGGNSSAASVGPGSELSGLLDKPGRGLSKSLSGAASVSGSSPSEEGEIYIRPDGKKVRRIRRTSSAKGLSSPASPKPPSSGTSDGGRTLSALLDNQPKKKNLEPSGGDSVHEVATVAGDRVIKSTDEGEIVIRADGKKVRRVKRTTTTTAAAATAPNKTQEQEGEVYRRADGKLVRRVRKTAPAPVPMASTPPALSITGGGANTATGPVSKLNAEDEKIAETYRKMLGMGLPDDAVRHKMNQDGVDPEIIRSVLNREVPAPKTGANGASSSGPALTVDEESTASRFRKMLKMGLPEDAVLHKMVQEGIDHKVIVSVVGAAAAGPAPQAEQSALVAPPGPSLSPEEEEIASKFRKMTKMGLPDDAVKHKMVQEGVDAKIIVAVLGGATSSSPVEAASLTSDEEATAARFRKMLKMGLPPDAVKIKMEAEGVDHRVISVVVGSVAPAPTPPARTAQSAQSPVPTTTAVSGDEAIANRFRKMLSMGLPEDAVKHKMVAEGVDEKIIKAVLEPEPEPFAPAPARAAPPAPAAPPVPAPAPAAPPVPARAAVAAAPAPALVSLSSEEEETANRFRKMLKMGLPPDAVMQKMSVEGADDKIVKAVLGGGGAAPPAPVAAAPPAPVAPAPPPVSVNLSPEEEETANRFRKMLKMGLPPDAVMQKMSVEGADDKIVKAVLGGGGAAPTPAPAPTARQPAPPPAPTARQPAPTAQPGSAAYVVVIDDHPQLPNLPVATAADIKSSPDDKFTVSIGDQNSSSGAKKLMSLDDIAAATGQSKAELEKMVREKQAKGEPINFSLNHADGRKADGTLFEVNISGGGGGGGDGPRMDPNKKYAEIGEGKEVVDKKLAEAARAVSVLGDTDMAALLGKLQAGDMEVLLNKLKEAEKRQKKLEKQLAQAGVAIAEDIDYEECKRKVEEIAKRMGEIGGSDVTVADKDEQNKLREEYFKLEQEMERFNTALMMTEEYQAEQDRLEQKWEDDNAPGNIEALRMIRRHMPVEIRKMSEADLTNKPSPNGKYLPAAIAKKFKRTNVLQCLRLNPDDLERMHPSTLENMRVTGLTLTERRAVYCHLKCLGPKWEKNKAEKMTERKWTWFKMMKSNFKENLAPYQRHVDQYGPPENHQCPLIGKQCPIKADLVLDYRGDYGWTPEAEYEVSDVKKSDADDPGAKAMQEALELAREKKANERADLLKKHYKGKLLQVSKANGSCESMDESMDKMEFHTIKWFEDAIKNPNGGADADKKKEVANFTEALNELKLASLDFCQRSGMQMSGKKKAGGDGEDIRSSVEGSLAEEVWETAGEFFLYIKNRMKAMDVVDTRIDKTIELLQGMLNELHEKNNDLFKALGVTRAERSRKLKKNDDVKKEIEEKIKAAAAAEAAKKAPAEEDAGGPPIPRGGGGRGGLLDAIGGRGRGGGGRGGLLDAISGAKGRGRGGRPGGGGRGGLLDAIAGARGKGGGGDDGGGGGRGGLLAAIQGRGPKPGGGGDAGGGRGGLLAAIAARGGG